MECTVVSEDPLIRLYNGDMLDNTLEDKSVQLIIADPPYFEVKGEFDFVWDSFDSYLEDVEKWAKECKRVLADNGSLLWWGYSKKIAYTQVILDRYFQLENSMVWRKIDSMQYQYYSVDQSRSFNTHNERLLFYTNDWESPEWNQTGWEKVLEKHIKPIHPFAKYLRSEFKIAGVNNREIAALFPSKNGGMTGCVSNWLNGDNVITEEQYLKIREYLNGEFLRTEYEELRTEYEELRRPFNNNLKLEDVLEFSQQSNMTTKYNHPTQKPEQLTRALILTCSKPGQIVFIPFVGSGTEMAMCAKEYRNAYGCEVNTKYIPIIKKRVKQHIAQGQLFRPTDQNLNEDSQQLTIE